jgi:hypothetical protein
MLTNRVIGHLNLKSLNSLTLQNYCNMKSENDSTCNNLFSPIIEEKREDYVLRHIVIKMKTMMIFM